MPNNIEQTCHFCGVKYQRPVHRVNKAKKAGYKYSFCTVRCTNNHLKNLKGAELLARDKCLQQGRGPHSEETKKKISEAHTGRKLSPEHIEKVASKLRGRKRPPMSDEWRKNLSEGKKGVKPNLSAQQREAMSERAKALRHSPETKLKMSESKRGEKSVNWKGGVTPEHKRLRNSSLFSQWRLDVFTRDNWTCQKTGIRGGKLHPHHILNFATSPDLRFEVDNGITLSEAAHKKFHKVYGSSNNNIEQLKEFIENPNWGEAKVLAESFK